MISLKRYLGVTHQETRVWKTCPGTGTSSRFSWRPMALRCWRWGIAAWRRVPVWETVCRADLDEAEVGIVGGNERREFRRAPDASARGDLREWGHDTARHYQQKAAEVKSMLLSMARIAQTVGARDERYTMQMTEVTQRLKTIGSLDDLTQVRTSIEKCATDLRTSIDRMRAEGKATLDELSKQVTEYRTRLEAAEELAWRDSLTGLSSRLYVEGQIEKRIADQTPFCVSVLDIDGSECERSSRPPRR